MKTQDKWRSAFIRFKLIIVILEDIFFFSWSRNRCIPKKIKTENIVIIGIELSNKGSQAMAFTVIDKLRNIFPDKTIYLFSEHDFNKKNEEKNNCKFIILPWNFEIKLKLLSLMSKLSEKNNKSNRMEDQLRRIVKKTEFFVDASGYALSSQWGPFWSVNYLLNLIVAKRFRIPYFIFPQSIGPFNYKFIYKVFLYFLMKLYLKFPRKIFVREKEGLKYLNKFTEENLERSCDIVLQNNGYNLSNIYNKEPCLKDIKVHSNSVGIIPNIRVIERVDTEKIYSVYHSLINKLIDNGKKVYILKHSLEDSGICEKIKSLFPDNTEIKLINDDLNAIEIESVIKQFDFIISSRYHSIIFAYKNGIPALVIGWATKYFELLQNFDQLEYFLDIRNNMYADDLNTKLNRLISSFKCESENIINKLDLLTKENIFTIFKQD